MLDVLEWEKGVAPLYIMDGTAGGSHAFNVPDSPITMYKDVRKWGYSRIKATKKSLTWIHKHIDGTIVDQVTIYPWNTN